MILKHLLSAAIACCLSSNASFAQTDQPLVVAPVAPAQNVRVLPANTEIIMAMNNELTTKRAEVGQTFDLTVVADVIVDGNVVIPKGAKGGGEVTWRTGKGAFGKSGKMEVDLRYVEVGGRRVPVTGNYRQEGEGNTVATAAAVALVLVAAPFISGKSGVIPAGRELSARTKDDLPFVVAAAPEPAVAPVVVPATTTVQAATPVATVQPAVATVPR
jgi:hypothetical protein